ncbi:MAG: DegT/DnrJ/EryC1/StrS family aminotransferase [Bacteroidetes bacterium]|nr:DegT/DnrJ/EryC1/StrS family aminotransferase [Bacteroidota bacterium]
MIPVTKTFLPPLEEYTAQVSRAFQNEWLTNRGELVLELESKLKTYLGVSNILIMNNGTIPIQIAVKLLGGGGEIITTPFSYVATTSSIVWENCTPVFVDIDPVHLTIDETKIEAAITSRTTCILATHVYGNPCNVEVIGDIAKRHNLKVIYDAAHCFGVKYKGRSIFEYGDISTCSFHATKVFQTGEGGAAFCEDEELRKRIFYSHNFGHNGPLDFHGLGINGKISELQAAMGLAVYPYMDKIFSGRKRAVDQYNSSLDFKVLQTMALRDGTDWNFSYYPIILDTESIMLRLETALKENGIVPRRYFYPALNTINYIQQAGNTPIAADIASRILCLPLYADLGESDCDRICDIISKILQ